MRRTGEPAREAYLARAGSSGPRAQAGNLCQRS